MSSSEVSNFPALEYDFVLGAGTDDEASISVNASCYSDAKTQLDAKVRVREKVPLFGYLLPGNLPVKLVDVVMP